MDELKTYLLFLLCFGPFFLNAQEINISFPKEGNNSYSLVIYRGIKTDTIQAGALNLSGKVKLKIPSSYKDYRRIALLSIGDKSSLRIVLDGNSFSIGEDGDGGYRFEGTKESAYLYDFLINNPSFKRDTAYFADCFIEDFFFVRKLHQVVIEGRGTLSDKANLRLFAIDKLDFDNLYTTGLWYYVVDGIVRLSPGQELLGEDMTRILKRIKSQEVFEHLLSNLVTITEQYGWDDAFETIVSYAKESGRIQVPQGDIYTAFQSIKVRKGMVAPKIEGLETPLAYQDALLIFYQPDCHNCEAQLQELIKIYPSLEEKNIRVIALSADSEKANVKKDKDRFPWVDTLCDLEGFAGENFTNYGVMGTPTFFLLDKEHRLVRKFALISDVKGALNL